MQQNPNKHLGYTLAQITRIWNQRFMDILRIKGYYNLKPSFCAVFFPLFEDDGQSSSELARKTKMTKQTMSSYVQELRKRGYVKMLRDENDKRMQRVFLTTKGHLLRKIFDSANTTISREICRELDTTEIAKLSMLLEKCLEFKK